MKIIKLNKIFITTNSLGDARVEQDFWEDKKLTWKEKCVLLEIGYAICCYGENTRSNIRENLVRKDQISIKLYNKTISSGIKHGYLKEVIQ